jgi:hypothetical protein
MADYNSRSPGVSAYLKEIKSEQYVTLVVQAAIPSAMTTQGIAEATSLEPELSKLRQAITTGKRLSKGLDHFRLRKRVVELAHGSHQGIVKTKRLIRLRVWFSGIDEMTLQGDVRLNHRSKPKPPLNRFRPQFIEFRAF